MKAKEFVRCKYVRWILHPCIHIVSILNKMFCIMLFTNILMLIFWETVYDVYKNVILLFINSYRSLMICKLFFLPKFSWIKYLMLTVYYEETNFATFHLYMLRLKLIWLIFSYIWILKDYCKMHCKVIPLMCQEDLTSNTEFILKAHLCVVNVLSEIISWQSLYCLQCIRARKT
jgi:hypothetical protein